MLILIGLLYWVFSLSRRPPEESGTAAPRPSTPHPAAPARVNDDALPRRLVFVSGSRDSLVIERRDGEYWVLSPIVDLASDETVREIARQIDGLAPTRRLPDVDARPFGLEPPRRRTRVEWPGGRVWTLALGDSAPAASAYYARLQDDPQVALLDQYAVRQYFSPSLTLLRDRYPSHLDVGPLDSVTVITRTSRFRAARRSAEHWIAREPAALPVDPLRLNRALERLRQPTIVDFPPIQFVDLPAMGLEPPRATWILHQGSQHDTVRIGHATRDQKHAVCLPARRRAAAFLSSELYRDLVDGWPALADLRLTRLSPDSVIAVEFLYPAAPALTRSAQGWQRASATVRDADQLARDLMNLTQLQWRRYPVEAPNAPAEPLRLALRTASRAETISLGAPRDSLGLATASGRDRWGWVSPLVWRAWRYRATHP